MKRDAHSDPAHGGGVMAATSEQPGLSPHLHADGAAHGTQHGTAHGGRRKIAFLFSGQGSQYYQMGRGLYEQNLVFRASMDEMESEARALLGVSVLQTLYGTRSKAEAFDDIRLSHPAIFMLEYALAQTLIELGIRPACTMGASLGTFAALAVAGVLSRREALAMVCRQGLAIAEHCPRGGMIAVLAAPELYTASPFLQARSVIAGQNFQDHFVLAAPQANLAAILAFLARAGLTHQLLPVQYPFHAPWIEEQRMRLQEACLHALPAQFAGGTVPGALPVYCCALGGQVRELSAAWLWQIARAPIAFMPTVAQMEADGPFDYLDLGPSGTLATFLKYLLPPASSSRAQALMTPYGRDVDVLSQALALVRGGAPPPGTPDKAASG